MTRIRVPERSMGVEMAQGHTYRAQRGFIEVDSAADVRQINRSLVGQRDWIGHGGTFLGEHTSRAADRVCPDCHRTLWPWETDCPRRGDQP